MCQFPAQKQNYRRTAALYVGTEPTVSFLLYKRTYARVDHVILVHYCTARPLGYTLCPQKS